MSYKAGFIGCGNMGSALAKAVSTSVGGHNIIIYDTNEDKAKSVSASLGADFGSPQSFINSSKFIFLAVKPQIMATAIPPLLESINASNSIIVTMAAGLGINYFKEDLSITRPIIRIMPNTPCSVSEGMILYDYSIDVSSDSLEEFEGILSNAGVLHHLPEALIDAGSAVSGCGPAFAYIFIESLADAGVECGLARDEAILFAAQMLKGSAEMVLQGGKPSILKDNVCSPGGTTIAGVHALEDLCFRSAVMNAVVAAYKRTLELKK